ncbi:MAG: hypothetical protein QM811_11795 [Pirellulales bacterium]
MSLEKTLGQTFALIARVGPPFFDIVLPALNAGPFAFQFFLRDGQRGFAFGQRLFADIEFAGPLFQLAGGLRLRVGEGRFFRSQFGPSFVETRSFVAQFGLKFRADGLVDAVEFVGQSRAEQAQLLALARKQVGHLAALFREELAQVFAGGLRSWRRAVGTIVHGNGAGRPATAFATSGDTPDARKRAAARIPFHALGHADPQVKPGPEEIVVAARSRRLFRPRGVPRQALQQAFDPANVVRLSLRQIDATEHRQ